MRFYRVILCCSIAVLFAGGCGGKDNARSIWNDFVKKCATTGLGGELLYFGPSNAAGAGSIWKHSTDGSYSLRATARRLDEAGVDFLEPGSAFGCQGQVTSSSKFSPSVGLHTELAPVSGELALDLNRAKKVTVAVDSLAWEVIEGIAFEQAVQALPANHPVKLDLAKPDRYVLSKALRVKGLRATLEFDSETGGTLSAKYPSGNLGPLGPAEIGVGITGRWVGRTVLEIEAGADFYIAGELRRVDTTGVAATGLLGPSIESGLESATVKLELL